MLRMIFIDFTVYGWASEPHNGRETEQKISSDDQDSNTVMWKMNYQWNNRYRLFQAQGILHGKMR